MDAAVCNPSLGTSSSRCYVSSRPSVCPDLRGSSVRLSSEVFKVEIGRPERSLFQSSGKKLSPIVALASQTSVSDPISISSKNNFSDSSKKSSMYLHSLPHCPQMIV